jgi:hypothetical protein
MGAKGMAPKTAQTETGTSQKEQYVENRSGFV